MSLAVSVCVKLQLKTRATTGTEERERDGQRKEQCGEYNARARDRQVYKVARQSIRDAAGEWKQEAEEGYDEYNWERERERKRVQLNCQQLKIGWERKEKGNREENEWIRKEVKRVERQTGAWEAANVSVVLLFDRRDDVFQMLVLMFFDVGPCVVLSSLSLSPSLTHTARWMKNVVEWASACTFKFAQ